MDLHKMGKGTRNKTRRKPKTDTSEREIFSCKRQLPKRFKGEKIFQERKWN